MTYTEQQEGQFSGEPTIFVRFFGGPRSWLYTNQAEDELIGAEEFLAEEISIDRIEQNLAEAENGLEIQLPSDSLVADEFKAYMPADPIQVVVYSRHRTDADQQLLPIFVGEVASCAFGDDGMATLLCHSTMAQANRTVPWCVYSSTCNHALYSTGCGVLPDEYRTEATVTAVVSPTVLTVNALSLFPDDWFRAGFVVRLSTNERRWISAHTGTSITLTAQFPGLQVGEPLYVFAGCDGLESTCRDKFNNLPRFWGFPDSPERNPFTEGVFGQGSAGGDPGTNPLPSPTPIGPD